MSQWRTVYVAGGGMLCLTVGLLIVGHWTGAGGAYGAFSLGIGACVSAVAAKAGWQHHVDAVNAEPPK